MNLPIPESISLIIREIQESFNNKSIPVLSAKLYSHYSLVKNGRHGLDSWSEEDFRESLETVIGLIYVGEIIAKNDPENSYIYFLRAGEVLEWLSHPDINKENQPLTFLAATCYQLSGYPARANALLNTYQEADMYSSNILGSFLQGDFLSLQNHIIKYWTQHTESQTEDLNNLGRQQILETIKIFGILSSFMRWGEDARIFQALDTFNNLSKLFARTTDSTSWLLAHLTSQVAYKYNEISLRNQIRLLLNNTSDSGKVAFERYERYAFLTKKSLVWPSQIRGINRLNQSRSFALCTPTGSGKTTIAEIAIIDTLFRDSVHNPYNNRQLAPLAIYLVPSRALATEVELKLSKVLSKVSDFQDEVQVTGLYGGNDWGPTEAWITATNKKTVLICTYEKGEALVRFLGSFFLDRIRLVVIDEAHQIQFTGKSQDLQTGESRSLRLEVLSARLLSRLNEDARVIALSAVTQGIESVLSKWVTGGDSNEAEITYYRSTRQIIGCLECAPNRNTRIALNLIDGKEIKDAQRQSTTFVPSPVPIVPQIQGDWIGSEKSLRPYLFWFAVNIAGQTEGNETPKSVLVSVAQKLYSFAKDLLILLDQWSTIPNNPLLLRERDFSNDEKDLFNKCKESILDYFGQESYEYRLLMQGVIIHHGKMPGLLSRLLIEIIERKIVTLVIATSTLSEGINLPFEYVLIPSLLRAGKVLDAREFLNLVGRAGRPGISTEGIALVVLPSMVMTREEKLDKIKQGYIRSRDRYDKRINSLNQSPSTAQSPLAILLDELYKTWQESFTGSLTEFMIWLEITAPLEITEDSQLISSLDSLDSILLSGIVESEQIHGRDLDILQIETYLKRIWQHSYAKYAVDNESFLESIFVKRGVSIKTNIYPNESTRRQLYRIGLPPRSSNLMLNVLPQIRTFFQTGYDYISWNSNKQLDYIENIISFINVVPNFRVSQKIPKPSKDWKDIISWWLTPQKSDIKPNKEEIDGWHSYVSSNFTYKSTWGINSVISLCFEDLDNAQILALTFDRWSQVNLPWIVFWLKELLSWGILNPVVSHILSHGLALTRKEAEDIAEKYFESLGNTTDFNEVLNPQLIRSWAIDFKRTISITEVRNNLNLPLNQLNVNLSQKFFPSIIGKKKRVLPTIMQERIVWRDVTGLELGNSDITFEWNDELSHTYDFYLEFSDVDKATLKTERFL